MEIDRTEKVGLETNPISDYNTFLKRLQIRRKMTPVTLTVLQKPQAVQHPLSPTLLKTPPILPATEADQDDEEDLVTEQVSVSEVKKFLRMGWWMKPRGCRPGNPVPVPG